MPEQALLLRTNKGSTIVSGCSHAGITKFIQSVRQRFSDPIHLVLGGFHTLDGSEASIRSTIDRFKQLGVENVAPSHCTGEDGVRLLKEAYGTHCLEIRVGDTIEA
jgi:7,8-dihydropterin-6-yl-methyl-4-(beta-D-ribofuranosyl)aminobenzene 5'-phosphate synthase